jgi:ABC-type Mn2+/Zn2+ transport system permease subunit
MSLLDPFALPFVQRGAWEILLLAVAAGPLGTWIVLRSLAFFSHAVGTASFPGLVLADGLGFPASLGALGSAGAFSATATALSGHRRVRRDSLTALLLAGALALGVILASDVFRSGAHVETLLFGSLLLVSGTDLLLSAVLVVLVLLANHLLGWRWLAAEFDPSAAPNLGGHRRLNDAVLLGLIAAACTVALTTVGALLVSAVFVIPAATTRLYSRRIACWQLATIGLAAAEGLFGLWLSVQTNAPPGSTIAVVAGGLFALAALARGPLRPALSSWKWRLG